MTGKKKDKEKPLEEIESLRRKIAQLKAREREHKRAREALRESATLNRTILTSLTDHIAIIDRDGIILAINEAWERFAGENGGYSTDLMGPGVNYLGILRRDASEKDEITRSALHGIQAVLERKEPAFQLEYPCDSPTQSRWFLMTVMPLKRPKGGVVISHRNITDRKEAEESLHKSRAGLRGLSSRLISVQEEERKKIARDLHDGIGQTLSAIKFTIENTLQKLAQGSSSSPVRPLEAVLPLIQNAMEEVRRIQTDLRPPTLDDLGILPTISWFCREYQKIYSGIRMEREIQVEENEVPDFLRTVIFRVLQEASNNIAKHSQATRVCLSLRKRDEGIELVVEDNGRGFDLQEILSEERGRRGFGLVSMRERTELSGGSFSVESKRGTGTRVRALWKLKSSSSGQGR